MAQSPDRSSDTGSDYNWPVDLNLEQVHQEQVLFENIAEEYVKGDDITVFFTILNDEKVNPDDDRIGLTRIGCTNMKECLLYAPVQITPSTAPGATRHGTATFSSTALPDTENEFYQFSYINSKNKCLGSSLPFQLNCSPVDADSLASNKMNKADRLITVADQDEADMLIVSTQRMLTEEKLRVENRHLSEIKRRLESEQEEFQAKLHALQSKLERTRELEEDNQALFTAHQTALEELNARKEAEQKILAEFEKTRLLCEEYHRDCLQHVERCQVLESAQGTLVQEASQLRSHLAVSNQLTKDQATQIVDLERRLMQSDEILKTANQRLITLEQQLRDQRLTAEKRLLSLEDANQAKNELLQKLEEENRDCRQTNERLSEENSRLTMTIEDQQQLIEQTQRQLEHTDAEYYAALNQMKTLQNRIEELSSAHESTGSLKRTLAMIEQRCVKHRTGELEAKKTLAEQKNNIDFLTRDNEDLRARLQSAEEEYKVLYRKYVQLEHGATATAPAGPTTAAPAIKILEGDQLLNLLGDTNGADADRQQEEEEDNIPFHDVSAPPTTQPDHVELPTCPICNNLFDKGYSVQKMEEHVNAHFQ